MMASCRSSSFPTKYIMYIFCIIALLCTLVRADVSNDLPDSVRRFEEKMKPAISTADSQKSDENASLVSPKFAHGFISSFSVIVVSEIGDKTFFIAAIMSMRHRRTVVFLGAISALIIMTLLSALLGTATQIIPRYITHYLSITLFIIFGLRMLNDAYKMKDDEGKEEFEEVERELNTKEMENSADVEQGLAANWATNMQTRMYAIMSRVFWQALSLTFVAEWGDRSQLATIILAAREDWIAVSIGAIIGHSLCTAFAVMAGAVVAQRVSVRTVTFVGAIVFLIFGVSAFVLGLYNGIDEA